MRVAVDPWDPGYGTPGAGGEPDDVSARVTLDLEVPADQWRPLPADREGWEPTQVLLVDGVRRVDARLWFGLDDDPVPQPGLAASHAAGVVRLDGSARVVAQRVERTLFTALGAARDLVTPLGTYRVAHAAGGDDDALRLALQQRMTSLEVAVADAARVDDDLLVVDGPLRGRTALPRAMGYVKAHHATYLDDARNAVVAALGPCERTPVFTIGTSWTRHAWYLRLPTSSTMPWAGIVRCEVADTLSRGEAVALAGVSCRVLPPLASLPHKDPRAPANLVPVGGLERTLRHRLGDAVKLHRAITVAAARVA
ncbi:hypothetical protein [Nocardioides litoris]|uniref:hypothetical protein n=1 Tax=Nocardioides litoris TaxID=1926648 RepID=UPI001124AD7A|nr:hypothetical protein [Nocardioides litoris]